MIDTIINTKPTPQKSNVKLLQKSPSRSMLVEVETSARRVELAVFEPQGSDYQMI